MPLNITGALIAALVAPVLGAMLYPSLHSLPTATKIFDKFMAFAVPALVVYHVAAHAWPDEMVVALMLVLGGLGTPLLVERASKKFAEHTDSVALTVGISGLAVHVIIESAVLRGGSTDLVLALVLHRMVVGLMVFWLVRPQYGFTMACFAVLAILVATALGFFALGNLMSNSETAEMYQYFVSGSLLHVIFHRSIGIHHRHSSGTPANHG